MGKEVNKSIHAFQASDAQKCHLQCSHRRPEWVSKPLPKQLIAYHKRPIWWKLVDLMHAHTLE